MVQARFNFEHQLIVSVAIDILCSLALAPCDAFASPPLLWLRAAHVVGKKPFCCCCWSKFRYRNRKFVGAQAWASITSLMFKLFVTTASAALVFVADPSDDDFNSSAVLVCPNSCTYPKHSVHSMNALLSPFTVLFTQNSANSQHIINYVVKIRTTNIVSPGCFLWALFVRNVAHTTQRPRLDHVFCCRLIVCRKPYIYCGSHTNVKHVDGCDQPSRKLLDDPTTHNITIESYHQDLARSTNQHKKTHTHTHYRYTPHICNHKL